MQSRPRAEPGTTFPSLKVNALARFISNAALVVTGFVSATVTARWLGPSGKGTLSTLLYIVAVASLFASLGVGDAATIIAGGSKRRLQKLLAVSMPALIVSSLIGIGILLAAAWLASWSGVVAAVLVGCVLIPARMLSILLINFQNSLELLIRTSLIVVVQVLVEMGFLVALVVVADLQIFGAVVAALVGSVISVGLSLRGLAQVGLRVRFAWDPLELRPLLKLGAPLIIAQLLIALAERVDLVIVYSLAGEASAGLYAIALTLGQLAGYASGSLAIAAFPRLARLPFPEAWSLVPRIARMGLASALISVAILGPVVPFGVPFLFGEAFSGAVRPTLILLIGSLVWSQLKILARSVAALGHPGPQLRSFAVYLGFMLVLDVLLIPRWGIIGAAVVSVTAPAIGLAVVVYWLRRHEVRLPLREFVPRVADFKELSQLLASLGPRALQLLRDPRRAWRA